VSPPKLASLIPQAPPPTGEVLHISAFGIVKQGEKILLLKMHRPDAYAGKWVLPARIINFGENPSEAMGRITQATLGSDAKSLKLIDLQSYGDRHWDLCCVYDIQVSGRSEPSKDVEKVEYFEVDSLPAELLEDHREVIQGLRDKKIL
jgi:ADP-ribose pyrophosphatase YjhB (NUDIX family)